MRLSGCRRVGLTLIELIVVIGIVGVLLTLLLSGVMRIRDAAYQLESKNNLRQIMLATHNYSDAHRGRLPVVAFNIRHGNIIYPVPRKPSVFLSILPYIEQGNAYKSFREKTSLPRPIELFLNPADPTVPAALAKGLAVSSYAANAEVFQKNPSLLTTFADGTSNTITFAGHYAYDCGGTSFYYSSNMLPDFRGQHHRATFSDETDVIPVTEGNPPISGPNFLQYTFQVAPSRRNCYPSVAQTPHFNGMLVAMGDGSVRTLAPSISTASYWGAVTPASGEIPGNDW
jgi:type II secretory pathway pseudopilin PulG